MEESCYTCQNSEIFDNPEHYTDGISSGELYGYCHKNNGKYNIFLPGGKCKNYKSKEGSQVSEELQEVIDRRTLWVGYEISSNEQAKNIIRNNINRMCDSWISTGFVLKQARDKEFYKEDGYSCIQDYAFGEFGIKKQRASRLIKIIEDLSVNGNSPVLEDKWKEFSIAKLEEIIYLDEEQQEQVTIGTTVAQIREIKNPEKVSTSKLEPEKAAPVQMKPKAHNLTIDFTRSLDDLAKEFEEKIDCPPGQSSCRRNWDPSGYYDRKKNGPCKDCIRCWKDWLTAEKIRSEAAGSEKAPVPEEPREIPVKQFPKVCKYDGKSNCVACTASCCAECKNHGSCNIECGWQDERIPKQENNPYDEKKPEPGTFIYCVCGDGKVEKYEVISKHSDFSPKYFNIKDKSGVVYDVSAESEHWHYTRDDAKKDPWYLEKKPDKSRVVDDTPVAADDTSEIVDNQPEIVNAAEEIVIPERECHNCNYNTMSLDEYRVQHPEAEEHPCNDCDDKLCHWSPKEEEPEQVEIVEADIIQTVPTKAYDFNKISQYGLTDVRLAIMDHQKNLAAYKDCELDAPIVQRVKMEMDALQALEESLYMHDMLEAPKPAQPELPQEAIEAMQYRIPKKMVNAGDDLYKCPTCGAIQVAEFWSKKIYSNYCPVCGQALMKLNKKTSNPSQM